MERERGGSRIEKENLFVVLPLSPYIPSILHLTILFFFFIGNLEISLTNNWRQVDYILSARVLYKARSFLQPSLKIFNMLSMLSKYMGRHVAKPFDMREICRSKVLDLRKNTKDYILYGRGSCTVTRDCMLPFNLQFILGSEKLLLRLTPFSNNFT